jgi:phosphoribosyl-dephospho-CoA transferase
MFYHESHSVRTHDLLEIDAKQLISARAPVPEWVEEHLLAVPFVVVRRGSVTDQRIPIGVRGCKRNQRWASFCSSKVLKDVISPPQLLGRMVPAQRGNAIPALCSLQQLKNRWMDLDHPWGPGGSVGFELATGRHAAKPESDLDIVIFAETNMTREDARSLCARTMDLAVAVDVRVETPSCGFSLAEYAQAGSAGILLRTPERLVLGNDPWSDELKMEYGGRAAGKSSNAP